MKHKQNGFTLLELMVVIAIIGFFASIVLLALNNARAKSREANRKEVADQVRKALELYYTANGLGYPNAAAPVSFNDPGLNTTLYPFINGLPNDILCSSGAMSCNFQYQSNSASYSTEYAIKIPFSNDGGTDCKFTSSGGTSLLPLVTQICNYQK